MADPFQHLDVMDWHVFNFLFDFVDFCFFNPFNFYLPYFAEFLYSDLQVYGITIYFGGVDLYIAEKF